MLPVGERGDGGGPHRLPDTGTRNISARAVKVEEYEEPLAQVKALRDAGHADDRLAHAAAQHIIRIAFLGR